MTYNNVAFLTVCQWAFLQFPLVLHDLTEFFKNNCSARFLILSSKGICLKLIEPGYNKLCFIY